MRSGEHLIEDVILEPGASDEARTLTLCADHHGRTQQLTITLDVQTTPP
jgi:hypothetical protein